MTATAAKLGAPSIRDQVSPAEWQARVELAACYRLVAHEQWSDGLGTHLAARVPDEPEHFLLNPVGLLFSEITASSLIKVDCDGNKLTESPYRVNSGGVAIHGAAYAARPDVMGSLHTHTEAGMAFSALEGDLEILPINPVGVRFYKKLALHDYQGQAGEFDDRDQIGRDLGLNFAMVMRNHGLLTVGKTIGHAFMTMLALEVAISTQLRAMSAGKIRVPPTHVAQRAAGNRAEKNDRTMDEGWAARLRFADKLDPSYRD
jgi:ribulose-5-phosphate 4-epimerase/fuculose-1-phosphate aldolase